MHSFFWRIKKRHHIYNSKIYCLEGLWDFPIHIETISKVEFLNYDVNLSLKVVLILANSADPDEMQHYAAYHLGIRCLPKYPFRGF